MAVINGTDGKVMTKKTTEAAAALAEIAGIDTWELEISVDTDETSSYADAPNKTYIATMTDVTATISGTYQTTGDQQTFIDELSSTGGGPSQHRLQLFGSTDPKDLYVVDGYFTSVSNTGSLGTKRSFSGSFQGSGGFRRTT